MNYRFLKGISILVFLTAINILPAFSQRTERLQIKAAERLISWKNPLIQWQHIAIPKLDSLKLGEDPETINLYYARELSYYPFREEECGLFIESLKKSLGRKFRHYRLNVITNNYQLNQLVPNYYRKQTLPVIHQGFPGLIRAGKYLFKSHLVFILPKDFGETL